jgi:hypothetical protein
VRRLWGIRSAIARPHGQDRFRRLPRFQLFRGMTPTRMRQSKLPDSSCSGAALPSTLPFCVELIDRDVSGAGDRL